ncbi:hypothetical protein [Gracilibacillus dipsosauri]|uniref:hypothetical protein n=1 Tax=Gracilibacillus dipsosauri TaxID=178340 RepID=UPI00240A27B8
METLEKIEVYEVSDDGSIIENYLWDAYEINEAISEDRHIIQFGWQGSLYEPKWDFVKEEWVEGLTDEEVRQREQEIIEQQSKLNEADMQALAILELAMEIEKLKGGS